jgi:hypothetical protein
MWHTLRTWRLSLEAGFDHVERSHYSTVNRKILRKNNTTDLTVQSMWNLSLQRQSWLGMVPLSLMEGGGEKKRGKTEKRNWQLIQIHC